MPAARAKGSWAGEALLDERAAREGDDLTHLVLLKGCERHRVALTSWPINDDPCGTFNSADELFSHARDSGYDGLEVTVDDMRKSFFPGQSYDEIISQVT